jgi:hypothetical protein
VHIAVVVDIGAMSEQKIDDAKVDELGNRSVAQALHLSVKSSPPNAAGERSQPTMLSVTTHARAVESLT